MVHYKGDNVALLAKLALNTRIAIAGSLFENRDVSTVLVSLVVKDDLHPHFIARCDLARSEQASTVARSEPYATLVNAQHVHKHGSLHNYDFAVGNDHFASYRGGRENAEGQHDG